MKLTVLTLILVLVFFTLTLNAEVNTSALWRSAVLAGWGQHHSGATGRGYFFMGTEAVTLGTSVALFFMQDKARDDYTGATTDFDNKWDDYTKKSQMFQIAAGITGALYVYNLIDAAFFTKSTGITLKDSPIKVNLYAQNELKYDVSYSKKF